MFVGVDEVGAGVGGDKIDGVLEAGEAEGFAGEGDLGGDAAVTLGPHQLEVPNAPRRTTPPVPSGPHMSEPG